MKCSNCGFEIEEDASFCPECGTKVEVIDSVEEKAEATTEAAEEVKNEEPVEEVKAEEPVEEKVEEVKVEEKTEETTTSSDDDNSRYTIDEGVTYSFTEPNYDAAKNGKNAWACFAGFGCGIGMFLCNPCYLTFICAVVFSIIGLCGKSDKTVFAIIGLVAAAVGLIVQFVLDLISGGLGVLL